MADDSASRRRRFEFVRADELSAISPTDWTVRDVLEHRALACLFGDAESYKTFILISLAYCVAAGTPWFGHAVTRGSVFCLFGEGKGGIGRRIRAWEIQHAAGVEGTPFFANFAGLDLLCEADTLELAEEINRRGRETLVGPRLIIVDTLSRHFGGDENSSEDMARLIRNLDLLREVTGAAVVVAHHSGHGAKDRARGSSVLRAALDTELRAYRDGSHVCLQGTKAKDHERLPLHRFGLQVVKLGVVDEGGCELTSLALTPAEPGSTARAPNRGKNERHALLKLRELMGREEARLIEAGMDANHASACARVTFRAWREETKLNGKRWSEVWRALTQTGAVRVVDGHVELVEA